MVLVTWEDWRILKIRIYELDGQAKGMATPYSYAIFQNILLSLEDRQLSVCDQIAGSFYTVCDGEPKHSRVVNIVCIKYVVIYIYILWSQWQTC